MLMTHVSVICVTVAARIEHLHLMAGDLWSGSRRAVRAWDEMPPADWSRLLCCWIWSDLRKTMNA